MLQEISIKVIHIAQFWSQAVFRGYRHIHSFIQQTETDA